MANINEEQQKIIPATAVGRLLAGGSLGSVAGRALAWLCFRCFM